MLLIQFSVSFLLLFAHPVLSASHRLVYQFTALRKPDGFSGPEFSAVGLYDDRQIARYSNEDQPWKTDQLYSGIWTPDVSRDRFLHEIKTLADCTNSGCNSLHILQRRMGCEVNKVMNVTFDDHGYDGEDFIAFNFSTAEWMEKTPKAKETIRRWKSQAGHKASVKNDLQICTNWISTFNASISTPPEVHMFASEAPHDRMKLNLMCVATGFYPKHIEMKITLNDTDLTFSSTVVRPSENQTFQMRISVEIDRDQRDGYHCHVTHGTQTNTTSWDGKCSRCSEESAVILAAIVSASVAVAVLCVISIIYAIRKLQGHVVVSGSTRNEAVTTGSAHLLKTDGLNWSYDTLHVHCYQKQDSEMV